MLVAITITMRRRMGMGTTRRAKGIRIAMGCAAIYPSRRRTSANALTMFWLISRWTLTGHAAGMFLRSHSRQGLASFVPRRRYGCTSIIKSS